MAIAQYEAFLERSDVGRHRRIENWRTRLVEMLRAELMQRVRRDYLTETAARELAEKLRPMSAIRTQRLTRYLAGLDAAECIRSWCVRLAAQLFLVSC